MTITFLVLIVIFFFLYKWFMQESREEREKAPFAVTVLETGKSDCIIIETGGEIILVDSGEDKNAKKILRYLKKKNIKEIDYFILTHPDKDHIGGADHILRELKVKQLIHSHYEANTKQYKQYIEVCSEKGIVPKTLKEPMKFQINDAQFTLYPPERLYYEEDNDYSLVLSVVYKKTSFLFAGDAEETRLKELMRIDNLQHTFLKVPHHGKYNEQTKLFLQQVAPSYSVITCSDEEPPKKKTLKALDALNVKTFLTSKGTVYCTSNGKKIKITQ
ncbi:ComEC/Rec2 family competence protein [Bacillus massiliigorillae]|uniref:ComEC/Rec2 family competence protein n=1 Tax=Bacillus massiliigorillae TaxID=1243664 RepID=UPI0006939868|nr:MBL fold metallo-hydrolase [Bacillus massiliigorillae]